VALLLIVHEHVEAIGRGGAKGGGGGGHKGGGGVGGGGARPAPHAASRPAAHTPSMSAGHRPQPQRPQMQRPSPAKAQAPRPAVAQRPQMPQKPAARPGGQQQFQMPGNHNRPTQLAKGGGSPVQMRPGAGGGGIQPKIGGNQPKIGGNQPKIGGNQPKIGGNQPKIGGKDRPSLADLQKKNPSGIFDRPKGGDRFPGAGKLPDNRPGGGDTAAWLKPGSRPGQGGAGTQWPNRPKFDPGKFDPKRLPDKIDPKTGFDKFPKDRPRWPSVRPDNKIHNEFAKNWNNAIGNKVNIGKIGNTNIGNTNVGDIAVDLSQNYNFQQFNNNRNVINNNFRPYQGNWFNDSWWNNRPYAGDWPAWHYHNYQPASNWWQGATWAGLTSWMGSAAWSPPVYSDYGSNVVVDQDVVYVNEQPIASAPAYAMQALELADVAPPPPEAKIEWMPLGTWALSSDKGDDNPSTVLQLAVSKEGLVSGTWYNRTTDKSAECEGQVDPDTQRLALRRSEQPDVVLEVGVYNLTRDASSCLMHFGTLNTQTWYMSRLDNPGAAK
jgi:hypothetical protein